MNEAEINAAFGEIFDQALVFHGFADYMRDYLLYVHCTADPRTGIQPETLRYRFIHCVRAIVTTEVRNAAFRPTLRFLSGSKKALSFISFVS